MPEIYTAAECAAALGYGDVNSFYRDRAKLHAAGMPHSKRPGRIAIPRRAFDAWLNAEHPLAPRAPAANDTAPVAELEQHRAELAAAYGRR